MLSTALGGRVRILKERTRTPSEVDRWYASSQTCCHCGHRHKLELSERVFICPNCTLWINRDHNAAINILREGIKKIGQV